MFAVRFGPFEFAPTVVPTVAAAFAIALMVCLGRWQLTRAGEKEMLRHQYEVTRTAPAVSVTGREGDEARHLQFRQLTVAGEFEPTQQIFLDNQVENGQAGYYVLTPLKLLDDRRYVLINRGWIARGPEYPAPPKVAVPSGRVKLQGYGALPAKRFLELSADTVQGDVWENVTFERYERITGLPLLPIILVQTVGNLQGLTPLKEQADFGITKHQGYAFQWFALSVAVMAIYVYVNTRMRPTEESRLRK
jgi:surfeit locus 1 family protein